MEVELASASSGLKPFSLKIKLTDKWLAKKAPSQLVALFLKHYDAKFGGASRAGDYVLGARGAPGSLDEAKPLRCGVTPGVALELRAAGAAPAAPAPAPKAAPAAARKPAAAKAPAPEPPRETRSADEAFSSLCALDEALAGAEFSLHTSLIYRVVEGLVEPKQLPKETAPHYAAVRALVLETSAANLDAAIRRFAGGGDGLGATTLRKLRKQLKPMRWALAKEAWCAKAFVGAAPVKRARLRRFENQHELPRRDELLELFEVECGPRTRWRPKWAPESRRKVVLDGLGLREEGDERKVFDAAALAVPDLLLIATAAERHGCEFAPFSYFVQNNYDPRYCLTHEAVRELATYLKDRIAIKPLGFRDVAVEMNAGNGRLAYFVQRAGQGKIATSGNDFVVKAAELDVDPAGHAIGAPGSSSFPVDRMDLRNVYLNYRPAILFCAWRYSSGVEDWLTKMKETVRDPDFMIDVPEYVLIGPSAQLLGPIYERERLKKLQRDVEGYDDDVDVDAAKPKRRDPDKPWAAFEGYDAYHVESVSRHLLHLADVGCPKYGHACCVSFRSAGQRLSQFRTLAEIEHSKAQGKVAKAMANAQRGELPNEAEQREIAEAQEVMNKADKAIKDNVRTPLSTAD